MQICTVNLKYITSNAEKIPSPKTPSQIIPWPKHKKLQSAVSRTNKTLERFWNLPSASPAHPWLRCHHNNANNSGRVNRTLAAPRSDSSAENNPLEMQPGRWREKWRLSKEGRGLHQCAGSRSQGLLSSSSLPCWCSLRCSHLQKHYSTSEIQPQLQKGQALTSKQTSTDNNTPQCFQSHQLSETEVFFFSFFPFNLSYSSDPAKIKGGVLHSVPPLHTKQHYLLTWRYQASQLQRCKPAEPFFQRTVNWKKRLSPTFRALIESSWVVRLQTENISSGNQWQDDFILTWWLFRVGQPAE